MAEKPMDDQRLCSIVSMLVKDCEAYRDERSAERIKAMEYYDGIMADVPTEEGRSSVVSRDVRSAIKKVLPSVVRTILGNDKVVEYIPVGEGDDDQAEQATDYVNYVVFPESEGRTAVEDAIHDALRLRNGIIKTWYDHKTKVKTSTHSGLTEDEMAELVAGDDVEVLEHSERPETIETEQGPFELMLHDIKVRRREAEGCTKMAAIPLEDWLIHPEAVDLDTSPIVGENTRQRRSDLVAMGYDRDKIENLPLADGEDMEQGAEEDTRRRDVNDIDVLSKAMQEVEYYELYVRVDYDNDGIAELRRIVMAGGLGINNLLKNEEWDEAPYSDIVAERRPHQWEGNSVTDDVAEIQKVKTVLLRQTLDNLYWQNMPQPIVDSSAIKNPEALLSPQFGLPIEVKDGVDVRTAVGTHTIPFVADKSFSMLEYLDNEVTDRTGISDMSSGMPPDALQNVTAKASAMMEQAGIGQTEMMVRTIAHGLKRVFRQILRLTIQHQDKPRTVRLRDEWVQFDPRSWNSEMDATVNTGLGAGTRERDMMMMQQVVALQKEILVSMGPDIGTEFVGPQNLYNAVSKLTEAAGINSIDLYFTKPDEQSIQQKRQAAAQKPNPEMQKVQAQAMADKYKADMQAQIDREKAQTQAQLDGTKMDREMQLRRDEMAAEFDLKRTQMVEEFQLKRAQLAEELQLKREEMQAQRAIKMALGSQANEAKFATSGVNMGGEPG